MEQKTQQKKGMAEENNDDKNTGRVKKLLAAAVHNNMIKANKTKRIVTKTMVNHVYV